MNIIFYYVIYSSFYKIVNSNSKQQNNEFKYKKLNLLKNSKLNYINYKLYKFYKFNCANKFSKSLYP